jgi:hypothetical protein
MTLMKNIEAKRDEILNSPDTVGLANQKKAIAAIIGGIKSTEWETYMKQYLDEPQAEDLAAVPPKHDNSELRARQLARLLGTDDTRDDPDMQEKRAYLVANATCAQPTGTLLANKVDGIGNGGL